MKRGYLSQYFESVAAKKLTAVEVDPNTSHGHELNSIKELKEIFGTEDLLEMPAIQTKRFSLPATRIVCLRSIPK
jgi:hypothetical protein